MRSYLNFRPVFWWHCKNEQSGMSLVYKTRGQSVRRWSSWWEVGVMSEKGTAERATMLFALSMRLPRCLHGRFLCRHNTHTPPHTHPPRRQLQFYYYILISGWFSSFEFWCELAHLLHFPLGCVFGTVGFEHLMLYIIFFLTPFSHISHICPDKIYNKSKILSVLCT